MPGWVAKVQLSGYGIHISLEEVVECVCVCVVGVGVSVSVSHQISTLVPVTVIISKNIPR